MNKWRDGSVSSTICMKQIEIAIALYSLYQLALIDRPGKFWTYLCTSNHMILRPKNKLTSLSSLWLWHCLYCFYCNGLIDLFTFTLSIDPLIILWSVPLWFVLWKIYWWVRLGMNWRSNILKFFLDIEVWGDIISFLAQYLLFYLMRYSYVSIRNNRE